MAKFSILSISDQLTDVVPFTVIKPFHVHSVPLVLQQDPVVYRSDYYLHFSSEEMEAQKGEAICSRSHS